METFFETKNRRDIFNTTTLARITTTKKGNKNPRAMSKLKIPDEWR